MTGQLPCWIWDEGGKKGAVEYGTSAGDVEETEREQGFNE